MRPIPTSDLLDKNLFKKVPGNAKRIINPAPRVGARWNKPGEGVFLSKSRIEKIIKLKPKRLKNCDIFLGGSKLFLNK